jgi:Putative transposase/Transposase zinc-binding domain
LKYHDPLKQILSRTRPHWDQDGTRPAVRRAYGKALQCRTPELGAEIYGSNSEERIVYHTCKSRSCSSCGHRATLQWQRSWWAALPEAPYKGITFTMPKELWPLFRDNRHLAQALPALAAAVIQARMSAKYGLRVGLIAILHTFNGQLEFNSHVHTMVTAGGLDQTGDRWVSRVFYERDPLMQAWRRAVVALLRAALRADQFRTTTLAVEQTEALLAKQESRWWNIKIQSFKSKEHFLRYAGRYVRRPPIAQHRITCIGKRTVTFWYKDKKLHHRVYLQCPLEEFVDRWALHILEPYQHAVRFFGLFAPIPLGQTSAAVFAILRQKQKQRPKPRRWADSLMRDFGRDPLLDSTGERMKWLRRIVPEVPSSSQVDLRLTALP